MVRVSAAGSSATTDPNPLPGPEVLDEKGEVPEETRKARPECFNLLGIYSALSGQSLSEVLAEFAGAQFSHFKQRLTELAVLKLGPIGTEIGLNE